MHIEMFGAAGEVTGSCHLVSVNGHRLLLDCGLIQGGHKDEARNREPFPFDPASIDAVVLSHAHIDHSGRLPLLIKRGYTGPVYTHTAARDLCRILLKDSGYISERDAEWENRKRERKGLEPVTPLYTVAQAQAAMGQFESLRYGARRQLLPGVAVRLADAGHVLGSSIVELWLEEDGVTRKLVFSGDLGDVGAPIVRDPTPIEDADWVLMESTYGNRLHRPRADTLQKIEDVLRAAARDHANVLVPAFAVGRSQDLLYLLGRHFDQWCIGDWEIFLDSPLAIQATGIYARHADVYDEEAARLWRTNRRHPLLPNLHFTRTPAQSMAINNIRSGAIIIAASGMCTGRRVRHHLKHNIWRKDCHVIMVGFQAAGTTGRALVDGASHIRLWGETIKVGAQVHTIGGLSAHVDQAGLCRWYGHFRNHPRVVLVHGEPSSAQALAARLTRASGATVLILRTEMPVLTSPVSCTHGSVSDDPGYSHRNQLLNDTVRRGYDGLASRGEARRLRRGRTRTRPSVLQGLLRRTTRFDRYFTLGRMSAMRV